MPSLRDSQASRLGVGGTLRLDHLYVERQADKDLLQLCERSDFAYVLSSRQVGKSSLMVRTMDRLSQKGIWVASVDMTQLEQSITEERFYFSVLAEICRQLDEDAEAMEEWFFGQGNLSWVQRFIRWFENYLLTAPGQRIVIFFDEIDSVRKLAFKDDFFAAIRSLHNARALHAELRWLSFVLVGAATPEQLMSDATRTPFNVGSGVRLTDFTKDEAQELMAALPDASQEVLVRVLHWTAGHPYLTARTIAGLAEEPPAEWNEGAVDALVEDLFLSDRRRAEERNLDYVRQMLQGLERGKDRPDGTLTVYRTLLKAKQIPDQPQDLALSWLKLAGVTRANPDQTLTVRNLIYQRVFDLDWVDRHLPPPSWQELLTDFLKRNATWLVPFVLGVGAAAVGWQSLRYTDLFAQMETKSNELQSKSNELGDKDAEVRLATKKAKEEISAARAEAVKLNEDVRRSTQELKRQSGLAANRADQAAAYLALAHANQEFDGYRYLTGAVLGAEAVMRNPLQTATMLAFLRGRDLRKPFLAHRAHSKTILASVWSPDGNLVASASFDDSVVVWSPQRGVVTRLTGHTGGATSVAWSPDQRWLVSGATDGCVRLYPVATWGPPEIVSPEGSGFQVRTVAFSPDGRLLAANGANGTMRIWDLATKKVSTLVGHKEVVWGARWSHDGKWLVTVSEDRMVRVWRSPEWVLEKTLGPQPGSVMAVAWSPDSREFATAESDKKVRIWSVGTWAARELVGHEEAVSAVAWSSNGVLASGSWDDTVLVWSESGQPVIRLAGIESDVRSIDWNPKGTEFMIGSMNGALWSWKEDHDRSLDILRGHTGSVLSVAWNPVRNLVASGSSDHTVKLWDPVGRRPVVSLTEHRGSVETVAWSSDGSRLASGGQDLVIRIWTQQGDSWVSVALPPLNRRIRSLSWSADGQRLAAAAEDAVSVWNLAGNRWERVMTRPTIAAGGDWNRVRGVAFHPGGKWLATAWEDGRIRFWNWETGQINAVSGHANGVTSVAWSPDGRRLVSGSWDTEVVIWNISAECQATGSHKMTPRHKGDVVTVAWSPDGKRIASGSRDRWVRTWDADSGQQTGSYSQSGEPITAVSWSADSQHLASGALDKSVMIWEDPLSLVRVACKAWGYPNLTTKQWEEFFGDLTPYRQTCPAPK